MWFCKKKSAAVLRLYFKIFYFLFFLSSCSSYKSKEDELRKVRATYDKMCSHICSADLNGYMQLWAKSKDIQVIHPMYNDWQTGWDSVYNRYKLLLSAGIRCSFKNSKISIHLSGDNSMAWLTSDSQLTVEGDSTGGQQIWATFIFNKINNEWRAVHAFASSPSK